METATSSFIDKAISGLRKASLELEEFQLQLALGTAELSDKYEEVKKKFNTIINEAKEKLNEGRLKANELKGKFKELQVQLALGKALTKEAFKEQKEKILKKVDEIEIVLKASLLTGHHFKLHNEMEKFKIKMEILRLRFERGKLNTEKEFEAAKAEFAKRVDKIKLSFIEKESFLGKNWDHFCNEVSEAYAHFRRVFEKM